MTTFAILGGGAWGTAVAVLLAQNPRHRVRLWSARLESAHELAHRRENVRLLPSVPIPDAVTITADLAAAVAGIGMLVGEWSQSWPETSEE